MGPACSTRSPATDTMSSSAPSSGWWGWTRLAPPRSTTPESTAASPKRRTTPPARATPAKARVPELPLCRGRRPAAPAVATPADPTGPAAPKASIAAITTASRATITTAVTTIITPAERAPDEATSHHLRRYRLTGARAFIARLGGCKHRMQRRTAQRLLRDRIGRSLTLHQPGRRPPRPHPRRWHQTGSRQRAQRVRPPQQLCGDPQHPLPATARPDRRPQPPRPLSAVPGGRTAHLQRPRRRLPQRLPDRHWHDPRLLPGTGIPRAGLHDDP